MRGKSAAVCAHMMVLGATSERLCNVRAASAAYAERPG
jgi:hypothetical protein